MASYKPDYVVELNSYLQSRGLMANWRLVTEGPANAPTYVAYLSINGSEVSQGFSTTHNKAKALAVKGYFELIGLEFGTQSESTPDTQSKSIPDVEENMHIFRPPNDAELSDVDEAARANATSEVITTEDLATLTNQLPNGGCRYSSCAPTRAIDWLSQNKQNTLLTNIRKAGIRGPFPYMLHTFADALALCSVAPTNIAFFAIRLSDLSGLNVVTLPRGGVPEFSTDEDDRESDQGVADEEVGPTTDPFRLRGGASCGTSGSDDAHNWHTPERVSSPEPLDLAHTSRTTHAVDADDNAPGTSHDMEVDDDIDNETHSDQKQHYSGLDDDEDPQRLWINSPNARNLHRLIISLAVTPSISLEVESDFLFGCSPHNSDTSNFTPTFTVDAKFQPIAAFVERFKVETQGERSCIGSSVGSIMLLGPQCTDEASKKDFKFLGGDFVHRRHKPPEQTSKNTKKKTTQLGIQATAAANPSATFNFMTLREDGIETSDSTTATQWVVYYLLGPLLSMKNRSSRSYIMDYMTWPTPRYSNSMTVSFGMNTELPLSKTLQMRHGVSFCMRNHINMWVQHPQGFLCYITVDLCTYVEDIYVRKGILIDGDLPPSKALFKDESRNKGAENSKNKTIQRYLQGMHSKLRSSPPMGQALSGKIKNAIEGIDIKEGDPPNFTDTKVFWKRMNSKEEGVECFDTRYLERSG